MRAFVAGDISPKLTRLSRILREYGWQLAQQSDHVNQGGRYDLGIVMLRPGRDSRSTMAGLRRRIDPQLLLLATDIPGTSRFQALSLGADDLIDLTLPASLMMSRISALLRLRPGRLAQLYQIGDLSIDLSQRCVRRGGREILLSQREFQLLVLLAGHAGLVMKRSDIIEQLWQGDPAISDNAVDALASRLRRRLDGKASCKLLHTIRGVGYSLSAPEQWAMAG